MKELFSEEQFKEAKNLDKLPLECYQCGETFEVCKRSISQVRKKSHDRIARKFCSKACQGAYNITSVEVECSWCDKPLIKKLSQLKKSKSGRMFCNSACSARYNNSNKKSGYIRSKFEIYLEKTLSELYPNLTIETNNRKLVGLELDLFIPELNLAIEVNGITHYKPIYGQEKFERIQKNDKIKKRLLTEKKIDLLVLDISGIVHFSPEEAEPFIEIVKEKVVGPLGLEPRNRSFMRRVL